MARQKISLRQELPLLVWLVLFWGALWRDFSPGNLAFGLVLSLVVTKVFYLPPVQLSGRFNVFYALIYGFIFLVRVAAASFQVTIVALFRGPQTRNAVIAVKLRSHSDLMMTATGHTVSLIPGSLVVEVDRSSSTLYLHTLDVDSEEGMARVREQTRDTEAWLIRIMGTSAELAELKAEKSAAAKAGAGKENS